MHPETRARCGFTMIDMVVSTFIGLFLTANTMWGLPLFMSSMHRNSARQSLEADFARARSDAIREGLELS